MHAAFQEARRRVPDQMELALAEFTALLKLVQVRSGVNPGKIAERAGGGLSRSQAYQLLNQRVRTLPTRIGQVQLFLRACGLDDHQVAQVAHLWVELKEQRVADKADVPTRQQAAQLLVERILVFTGTDGAAAGRYLGEGGGSCFDGRLR